MSEVIMTEAQQKAKEQFIAERGIWKWSPMWENICLMDSNVVAAFAHFSSVPHKVNLIEPKVRELICIAIDAAITHLHEPGLRNHIKRAFELGATKEEILETLEICSAMGTHTLDVCVPILMEKFGIAREPLTPEQQAVKDKYLAEGDGSCTQAFEDAMRVDSMYMDAYVDFIDSSRKSSHLDEKTKEMLWLAVDASPTTLYAPGVAHHIENLIKLGATPLEIMHVFEIVAGLAVHSITVGVPLCKKIAEEMAQETAK